MIGGLLQPHGGSWIGAVSVISWGGMGRWADGIVFCEGGGGVVRNVRGKGVLALTAVSYSVISTRAVLAWNQAFVCGALYTDKWGYGSHSCGILSSDAWCAD